MISKIEIGKIGKIGSFLESNITDNGNSKMLFSDYREWVAKFLAYSAYSAYSLGYGKTLRKNADFRKSY